MLVANKHLLVVMNLMDHLVVNCEHYHITETMSISYSPKAAGSTSSTRLGYVHTASKRKIGSNTRHGGHVLFFYTLSATFYSISVLCPRVQTWSSTLYQYQHFTCIYKEENVYVYLLPRTIYSICAIIFCVSFMHM